MASPTLDLLCCSLSPFQRNITPTQHFSAIVDDTGVEVHKNFLQEAKKLFYLYNATVIFMCVLSIGGAICMLFPKLRCSGNGRTGATGGAAMGISRSSALETRQKWIVFWLSFADIMACLGLIVLSSETIRILVLSQEGPDGKLDPERFTSPSWEWLCIVMSAWIHFFFLATYMWTTCFAIDVYLYLRKTTIRNIFKAYFVSSWCLPLIFLTIGLVALFNTIKPEFACSAKKGADQMWLRTFYLCLFVPLVVVLVINPTLYILASRRVSPLMRAGVMYRDREREIERKVRRKFLKIVTVLVICWFPNVINGILLLSGVDVVVVDEKYGRKLNVAYGIIWIIMAILNPLQAFLNTLVYWGPTGCNILANSSTSYDSYDAMPDSVQRHPPLRNATVPSDTETSPLIRERTRDPVN